MKRNAITPGRLAEVLRTVPEKNLRLIEIANQIVGPDGRIDEKKRTKLEPELNLAEMEARAYVQTTHQAIEALRKIPAITEKE